MSLELGKSLDRRYTLRIPFLNFYYEIGIYFNKKSTFLLFSADKKDYDRVDGDISGSKLSMFKNLKSSKFCETFFNLHSYNSNNLDILDQFSSIKPTYDSYIEQFINESIILSKVKIQDKDLYDTLTIYGFTICAYEREFIFILAERQNIIKKLGKKIVRSTGLQIGTSKSLDVLEEFHLDSKKGKVGLM